MLKAAADRLIQVQNVRVFELWLAQAASQTKTPCLAWTSATVAAMAVRSVPVVVVLVGLSRRAWFALGLLHAIAWWRVRRTVGTTRNGYRVRVWVA